MSKVNLGFLVSCWLEVIMRFCYKLLKIKLKNKVIELYIDKILKRIMEV